jgi:5'-nucleotidase (lipoprotein e(P4) family)
VASAAAAAYADDVAWVLGSAEYQAAVWQAYALAGRRIEELAAGRTPGSWAVALDVDETVLSNVQYEVELEGTGIDFDEPTWQAWIARRAATPLPGALRFLRRVHELGGRIALVTNRDELERADTEANLRAAQVPFDFLLLRPSPDRSAKAPRWQAVDEGTAAPGEPPAKILLWVGDNIKDFPGLDQSLREAGEEALAAFGDRFVMVPNPMYGSWKPATPAPMAPAAAPAPAGDPAPATHGNPAPPVYVEEVRALLEKSLPAKLRVAVRGNLPDSCTHLGEPGVKRERRTFHLTVPASRDRDAVCAQALVPFAIEVPVDIIGLPSGTYTVEAGGQTDSFTLAQDN